MSDLEVIRYRPDPGEYAWTFGGAAPVRRITTPVALDLFTEDCFAGRVRSAADLVSTLNITGLNPQTGPFYIEGAEPGDTVAVHFVSIEPARDWAASTTVPLFGALTGTHLTALLHEPLEELMWIWQLDRAARTCRFTARKSDFTADLPMDPMHGTVGVAPAGGEVRSALVPDAFGGNMDTPEMRAGTTCYLGVNVDGALLSLGDGHARQGEGETCGVAVETAMNTRIVVDLIKNVGTPWPRLENDAYLMSAGSARPLEDAFRIAQHDMVTWVAQLCGLDPLDAYQLVTQAVESPLANVCDTNYTSIAKMPKRYLTTPAFGGVHAQLRELAASLQSRDVTSLDGKVILVTGATDGLGRALSAELARSGATVLVHGRDPGRIADTIAEIGGGRYAPTRPTSRTWPRSAPWRTRCCANEPRLDVLVNNAGIGTDVPGGGARQESADGYELRFAVNYLAGFALTERLLPLLASSAPSRIVNVSSLGQQAIDFDDVMLTRGYSGGRAYCQSKLAQILYTIDLAERLDGTGVSVNALHPATYMPTKIVHSPISTVAEGVEATRHLIAGDDVGTGRFYNGLRLGHPDAQAADPRPAADCATFPSV